MIKVITNEIKDSIIERVLEVRRGAFFEISNSDAEELFDINGGLFYSFFIELQALGYIRSLSGDFESVTAFTTSALDTFYLQGGFVKHYSIKNLLDVSVPKRQTV